MFNIMYYVKCTDGCVWGAACPVGAGGRGVAGGCHVDRNVSITLLSPAPKYFVFKIESTLTPDRFIPVLVSYFRLLNE